MTDFLAQQGEFQLMTTPKREDVIRALVKILNEADVHAIWAGIDASVWMDVTTPQFRLVYPKPYDLCFNAVVRQLNFWSQIHAGNGGVPMVFAVQDQYNNRTKQILNTWQQYSEFDQIGSLTFEYAGRLPALQAADILAHELFVAWKHFAANQATTGDVAISRVLRAITKNDMECGAFITEKALKLHVANPNWIDPYFPCPEEKGL